MSVRTKIDLQGSAKDLPGLYDIELKARGNGTDQRAALRLVGIRNMPDVPFEFSGALRRDSEKLELMELQETTVGSFVFRLVLLWLVIRWGDLKQIEWALAAKA